VTSRFLQNNAERTQIFALASGDGMDVGFGPLAMPQIYLDLYHTTPPSAWHPRGDPALGADLTARAAEFHLLDDFFHVYGYPPDLIAWIEATVLRDPDARGPYDDVGRPAEEVAERLGLDVERLRRAGAAEGIVEGQLDPAGDPLYHYTFGSNWAVADPAGRVTINPNSYRFKAWLSLAGLS